MDYNTIQNKLLSTIKDYFKYTIQRPELLNRIGDNFVVFDFIRETAAEEILNLKLKAIIENIEREKGITLSVSDRFKDYLLAKAKKDLTNGGRGISNMVETCLINPLSQILIKEDVRFGDSISIEDSVANSNEPFNYSITKC